MKKYFLLSLIWSLFLMSGCGQKSPSANQPDEDTTAVLTGIENTDQMEPADEITFQVIPAVIKKEQLDNKVRTIKAVITNHSADEVRTGDYYTIEHYIDNEWKKTPFPENICFELYLAMISAGSTRDFDIGIFTKNYDYVPGKYRVNKEIEIKNEKRILSAEFVIE